MSVTINPFGHVALSTAVNQMQPVPTFLRKALFGRVEEHPTKTVMVDIVVGGKKISPFVKRGDPAKVVGNLGQKTSTIEPPNIRLKKFLSPSDLLFTREANSPIFVASGAGGNDPIQTARMQKVAREQKDLRDIIDRTVEYLIAQGASGSYTITQDDLVFTINFSMPEANKPTLTSTRKWDAPTTAKPLADIRAWKTVASVASGKIPVLIAMNSTTYDLFIATTEVLTALDKRKINVGQIDTEKTIIESGAERRGSGIEGCDLYTYDATYTDANGATQKLIADNKVLLLSPSGDHRLHFGAIEDLEAGNVVGQFFSKDWVEKDPSGLWLLVESHPLPVYHEPAANIYATVA
jgi:hypothetical protein